MRTLPADLRHALRVILRTPGYALAVIAVLGLGIGANTAIFSLVNAVLLRPLPYDQPERLVAVLHTPPQDTFPGMPTFPLSPANFYDWQKEATSFEGMAMYRNRQFTLTGGGTARAVPAGAVGAGFFEVLRVRPALGRVFRADEDVPGARVAVLSEGFWKRELGGDANAVGRVIRLDGQAYTVVGVLPARASIESFGVMSRELWVPMGLTDEQRAVRENHNQRAIGRLKPTATVEAARAELSAIAKRLEAAYPADNAGWGAAVIPLQELIVGDVGTSLLMLLGAVGLVLLIACANVGNLMFTRALARRKEIAIRAALGAGRARVFQQLLVEAVVLAAAGGALGLALAQLALTSTATLLADQVPRADEIALDGRVLLFVIAASLVTGIVAGALPALRAGRTDLNDALKEGGRADGAIGLRTRRALIVCEVALSLVLLMGAGVMVRSLLALRNVDAGFQPENTLTMRVGLPASRYPDGAARRAFFDAATARLRALPGVVAVGTIDNLPFEGGSVQPMVLEGRPELLPREQPTVQVRAITPGYLRAIGIPVLSGRDVADADADVVLVSRSAAKLLWNTEDPIGKRITLPLVSRTQFRQVVGIVGDVKQGQVFEGTSPTVYTYSRERDTGFATFVLRTATPPATLIQPATAVFRALDPEQPVLDVRTMQEVRDEQLTSQRFTALLLAAFAIGALALAAAGIYSVLAYIVRGRSREIGIRTALGAQTGDVLSLILREGMSPALLGIAVGVVAAFAASSVLERLVFAVSAFDPVTLGGVAIVLAAVALLASVLPAYRAAKLDPLTVLRAE